MNLRDAIYAANESAYWRAGTDKFEARYLTVPCPRCKAQIGEPCVYRGKVRGPGDKRRFHLDRWPS